MTQFTFGTWLIAIIGYSTSIGTLIFMAKMYLTGNRDDGDNFWLYLILAYLSFIIAAITRWLVT